MEFLPTKPVFDQELYSEQMHTVLSDVARSCNTIISPPRKKFDREKFLAAIGEAFDLIGGVPRFAIWADQNQTEFYKICAKTIPQAQMLDIMGKLQHIIRPALPPSPLDGDFSDAEQVEKKSE
jgi:hypothetical protein